METAKDIKETIRELGVGHLWLEHWDVLGYNADECIIALNGQADEIRKRWAGAKPAEKIFANWVAGRMSIAGIEARDLAVRGRRD